MICDFWFFELVLFPLVWPAALCVKPSIDFHLEHFHLFCFPPGEAKTPLGAIVAGVAWVFNQQHRKASWPKLLWQIHKELKLIRNNLELVKC